MSPQKSVKLYPSFLAFLPHHRRLSLETPHISNAQESGPIT